MNFARYHYRRSGDLIEMLRDTPEKFGADIGGVPYSTLREYMERAWGLSRTEFFMASDWHYTPFDSVFPKRKGQ